MTNRTLILSLLVATTGLGRAGDLPETKPAIPQNIELWCLSHMHVARKDFPQYSQWYTESEPATQSFTIQPGDMTNTNGRANYARLEVSGGPSWGRDQGLMEFSADVQVTTTGADDGCLIQIFNYAKNEMHPALQIRYKRGILSVGDHGAAAQTGAERKQVSVMGKPFHVRVTSDGTQNKVYIDGKVIYDHPAYTATPGYVQSHAAPKLGFRWGLYCNAVPKAEFKSVMSNVTLVGPKK